MHTTFAPVVLKVGSGTKVNICAAVRARWRTRLLIVVNVNVQLNVRLNVHLIVNVNVHVNVHLNVHVNAFNGK